MNQRTAELRGVDPITNRGHETMAKRRVVVTGIGTVNAIGNSVKACETF